MTLSSEEIEIIGYVGGYVVAISSPFQLLKCLRTWKTRDVSLLWILNYLSGLYLIFAYGLLANLPAIWVPIILEMTCSTGIFILKVYIEFVEGVIYSAEAETQCDEHSAQEAEGDKVIYAKPLSKDYEGKEEDDKLVGMEMVKTA